MLKLSYVDSLLWAAGLVMPALLVAVLVARHRVRSFPMFTAFVAASVLRSLILIVLVHHYVARTYFLTYWSLAILVDVILQAAVVYETATHVFRPLGHWAPDARRGIAWIAAASLGTAAILTWLATPVSELWQESIVVKGSFFASVEMSELLVGMVLLSVTVGLPWRTHVARIAQALGTFSLLDVVLTTLHTVYGERYQAHIDLQLTNVRKFAWLACLAYWIVAMWREAPAPRELPEAARQQLRHLQARLAYDLYTLRSGRRP